MSTIMRKLMKKKIYATRLLWYGYSSQPKNIKSSQPNVAGKTMLLPSLI